MTDWCKQLGYAYVNVYDDEKFEEELRTVNLFSPRKRTEPVYELNDYGRKLSKVLLTCVSTLFHDIEKLRTQCKDDAAWKGMQIHLREKNNKENPLGEFFDNCGFIVSKDYNGYEGELLNKPECTGKYIYDSLYLNSKGLLPGQFRGPFTYLYRYLHKYNEVCHIATFTAKRHPCSVNEMLQWLSGLPHNNVFEQLKKHIKTLCDKPDDQKDIEYSQIHSDKLTFHAYPETLTAADLRLTLSDICSDSRNILTSILGNGDAYTTYACDLSNNSSVLHYPSNPSACLDMLLDILRRIFPPLKFLLNQCNNASSDCGWLQCRYGKDIRPSKSLCNEHTKSKIDCEPTSPLMSYLTDGLLGHLPHTLTSIGCRAVCINCPTGKPGMPCLTPLGFRGFSGSTRRGKDLCNVLGKLLTNVHIKALLSLGTKTPATLSEHFGFVSSLVNGWHNRTNIDKDGVQKSFEDAITKLSIALYEKPAELTDALRDAYGSESVSHSSCQHSHLLNLTDFDTCNRNGLHCAPYITSLCGDYYTYLPVKNSNTYLSWAIYLPWTFWIYSAISILLSALSTVRIGDAVDVSEETSARVASMVSSRMRRKQTPCVSVIQ
ncbi:Apolipophorin-III superfamily protein, putative [Babesia ovata]|uniref:Apolipophorin-III superfamily protein, putative n=1 Tax=Babesia ovata TaxID=189622 RepID=A0A2H6KIT4_9APIC|nr:Apolipophorin-III superfamily protein, putative [Babesia ovata]GBE62905.1 Apolipophorin-III superfamily protein, putative [Babesia ovata]